MARYHAITRRLVFNTLATFVGATLFLLSACQNLEPVPEPAPTNVRQPPTPLASVTPVAPQSNFAFVFEWSSCGAYTLNTFDNKLALQTVTSPQFVTTIDFVLSQQELRTIYQNMADVGLFNYPDEFSIQLPDDVIRVYGIPARYRFDIRNGAQRKAIHWNDEFGEPKDIPWKAEDSEPSRTQAAKLRELIRLIQQIVESHREFEKLPSPGGCA